MTLDFGDGIIPTEHFIYEVNERQIRPQPIQYEKLRPNFAFQSADAIAKTFKATTQYARMPTSSLLTKRYKSPYPALNVTRRQEDVSTDTVYSDTPAIDNGSTQAQIFCGSKTLVTDVYGMKTGNQFVNAFEDQIRQRGAMDRILSDSAVLRNYGESTRSYARLRYRELAKRTSSATPKPR